MDRLKDEKFAEFYKLYIKKVSPEYAQYEKRRHDILKSNVFTIFKAFGIMSVLCFVIFALIFLGEHTKTGNIDFDSYRITFILVWSTTMICCIVIPTNQSYEKFKLYLKSNIIPFLLHFYNNNNDTNVSWKSCKRRKIRNPLSSLGTYKTFCNTILKKSGLFLSYVDQECDDEFKGTYKGVNFAISELSLLSNYKNFVKIPLFKGLVLQYQTNKVINKRTIVSSSGASINKDGIQQVLGIFLIVTASYWLLSFYMNPHLIDLNMFIFELETSLFMGFVFTILLPLRLEIPIFSIMKGSIEDKDLSLVTLEDSKFNKKFKVYSSDQVEARYLVTPLFMEKFYNLKTAFGAKNIRCSFFDNNLMIAIETNRDLFELGNLFKPIWKYKTIKRFYDETTAMFEMIDYFKLNEDIYLK